MNDLLTMAFINICKTYINIEYHQKQISAMCNICNGTITEFEAEYICKDCFTVFEARIPGVRDTEKTNKFITQYSLWGNLSNAIDRFEGRGVIIEEGDITVITSEMKRVGVFLETVNRYQLSNILKDLKLSKYNDCINVLMFKLTGRPIRIISMHIDKILEYHKVLEYYYPLVKGSMDSTRINSLNVHYKLFKLLRMCGVDCTVSEFCSLRTPKTYSCYEETWKDLCKYTGWKHN